MNYLIGFLLLLNLAATLHTKHKLEKIMKTLADLEADVTAETSVENAMMVLVGQLVAEILDLKTTQTDPDTAARIDALASKVETNAATMQAAVVANTPAAPAP